MKSCSVITLMGHVHDNMIQLFISKVFYFDVQFLCIHFHFIFTMVMFIMSLDSHGPHIHWFTEALSLIFAVNSLVKSGRVFKLYKSSHSLHLPSSHIHARLR